MFFVISFIFQDFFCFHEKKSLQLERGFRRWQECQDQNKGIA